MATKYKQAKKGVTKADVDRVLKAIQPQASSKDLKKYRVANEKIQAKANAERDARVAKRKKATGGIYDTINDMSSKRGGSDEKTAQYLNNTATANAETNALGKKTERKRSWFERGVDVLSRPMYGSAEAFKEAFDPETKKFYEPGEAFKGFWSGLQGKEKTHFKDVLTQHGHTGKGMGTLGFALDIFADPSTYTGTGLVGKAVGIGGKIVKSKDVAKGIEDTAEIIRKATQDGDITRLRNLDNTPINIPVLNKNKVYQTNVPGLTVREMAATKKTQKVEVATRQDLIESLVPRLPVGQVSRRHAAKLSPEAKALFDLAKSTQKATGKSARKGSSEIRNLNTKTSSGKIVRDVLEDTARYSTAQVRERITKEVTAEAARKGKTLDKAPTPEAATLFKKQLNDEIEKRMEKAGFGKMEIQVYDKAGKPVVGSDGRLLKRTADRTETLREQLFAASARNLSPDIKKQFAIRVGPTKVGIPGVAAMATKGAEFASRPATVRKSIDMFNKGFRANAHVPVGVREIRSKFNSSMSTAIQAHGYEIKSVFDSIPKEVRAQMAKNLGKGTPMGMQVKGGISTITNQPVEDAMAYIQKEFAQLDNSINGRVGITPDELNAKLHRNSSLRVQHTFDDTGSKLTTKDGVTKATVGEQSFDPDFFMKSVMKGMATGKIKDPAAAIYEYSSAVNRIVAERQLYDTIGQTFGVPLRKNAAPYLDDMSKGIDTYATELTRSLMQKDGYHHAEVDGKIIKGLEGVVFPPEIAEGISNLTKVFSSPKSTGDIVNVYDKTLLTVKAVLTRYNPSFHPRTLMGEMILGAVGGMKDMPGSYSKALKVMKGRNKEFMGVGAPVGDAAKKAVEASNILRLGSTGRAAAVAGRNYEGAKTVMAFKMGNKVVNLTADAAWHHYMASGLKSGLASTDMVRNTDKTLGGGLIRKLGDASQGMTESIEDVGRLAHFLDAIRFGKANTLEGRIEDAAEIVRKTHLDYNEVTKFERDGMARAIPFYKWLRLSTPLIAEMLLTQPGKSMVLPKALQAAAANAGYNPNSPLPGGPDAAVPEYLRAAMAVPVGSINGNTQYFNPTSIFPLSGSAELTETASGNPAAAFMNVLNPALGAVAEIGLDSQNKGADPSRDKFKYAASQTPQTSFARKFFGGADEGVSKMELLLKFLGNPGLTSVTPDTIQSAAYQQRQEAYLNRREARRDAGLLEPKK